MDKALILWRADRDWEQEQVKIGFDERRGREVEYFSCALVTSFVDP